jgi:NAD(P)-dependent dehydrogenase (short-subunit alcohol dehydrogenase family)
MFPVTSRYYGIATVQTVAADGRTVVYLRRRFLPAAASAVTLVEHTVVEGDRLDNVTARYLGDPEQFWRVCDANNAMQPEELTAVIGRRLNIPLPQGS